MRDRLIELFKEVKFTPFRDGGGLYVSVKHQLPEHAFEAIADHLIANDVVKVVRCKDCKHSKQVGSFGCHCSNIQSPWFNDEYEIYMDLDDFCSYGERREE